MTRKQKKHPPAPRCQGIANAAHIPETTDLNDHPIGNENLNPLNLEADERQEQDGTQQPDSFSSLDDTSPEPEAEARHARKQKGKSRRRSRSPARSGIMGKYQESDFTSNDQNLLTPIAEIATRPIQEVSLNLQRAQTMPPTALNPPAPFLPRHNFVSAEDVERLVSRAESKIKANMLKEFKILTTVAHQPTATPASSSMPPPPRPVTSQASGSVSGPRLLPPSILSLPLEKHLEDEVVGIIRNYSIKGPTRVLRAGWAFTHKGTLRSCLWHCDSIRSRLSPEELARVTPRKKLRAHVQNA